MANAYDYSFDSLQGALYPLRALNGQALLVVNTASKCGFTPQYAGLQTLWERYKERGLVVIGVPSNDFGNQEPGDASEIGAFCESNYGVGFPVMGKQHVKGAAAHPFFKWAAGQGGFLSRPRWNFYKYLIGRDGAFIDWFASATKPESGKIITAIETALKQ